MASFQILSHFFQFIVQIIGKGLAAFGAVAIGNKFVKNRIGQLHRRC